MQMHRVITEYMGILDPNKDKYQEYANALGRIDMQEISDNWMGMNQVCWYFEDKESALLFKIYTGGRLL